MGAAVTVVVPGMLLSVVRCLRTVLMRPVCRVIHGVLRIVRTLTHLLAYCRNAATPIYPIIVALVP